MSVIRAKFFVTSITTTGDGKSKDETGAIMHQEAVELVPVYGGSEENKSFWKYSTSGKLNLTISNPSAQGVFELGKEYYIDFTPAESI